MTTTTILNKYDKAVYKLITAFEVKQFLKGEDFERIFEGWVGDIVGGIAYFDDITIDFSDIVYDLRTNQPKENIVKWYFHNVDNEAYINYHSYCLGLRHENIEK